MAVGRPQRLRSQCTTGPWRFQLRTRAGREFPSVRRVRIASVNLAAPQAAPTPCADRVTPIVDGALHIVCGATLIATLLLPWTRHGNASLLTGDRLAGFLLTDGQRLAAIAIYTLGAVGCLIIAAGASRRTLIRAASATLAGFTLGGLLVVGAVGPLPIERWGEGPILGVAGAALVLLVDLCSLFDRPAERHAVVS